ncbi:MAG: ATP-binding protein [Spirochaetales bacterium]
MSAFQWPKVWRGAWLSLASFALGLVLRLVLQGVMGTKLIWLTFYPVVMLAALFGGVWSGLATAFLSAAFALFAWPLLSPQPFVAALADQLGVGVFLFNGLMMSLVAESMLRARRRAEAARQEAEAANRAKSVFLAQMSHELLTPFNALLGFSSVLLHAPDTTPRQQEILGIIHRNGTHLLELINNVLEMSRIEAGKTTLRLEPTWVRNLVAEVVELLRERAEGKGLGLTVEVEPGTPPVVLTDALKFRQILTNLVGNAIKFSDRGTVRVGLRPEPGRDGDFPWLGLWVSDTGPGIAPEDQTRVFAAFEQVGPPNAGEGTGLGLAIVDQLVRALGGTVRLESALGTGSCFYVAFPAQPVSSLAIEGLPPATASLLAQVQVAPGSEGHRFLVVDDQSDNRLLLKTIHDELGQQCRLASNGEEAVQVFRQWHPELIWMDVRMAGMGGIEAVRRIRALPGGNLPIIAVTASVFVEQQESLLAQGFDAMLTKPYPLEAIRSLMTAHLGLEFVVPRPVIVPSVPGDLPPLPAEEALAVRQALDSLDPELIDQTIQAFQRRNPVLGSYLRLSVESLDYTGLRAKLDALRPSSHSSGGTP